MLSTIAVVAARQARVAGTLSVRRANRTAMHLGARTTTTIPNGFRVAAVFTRGYAEARAKKTSTDAESTEPKEKKTKAKKTTAVKKKAVKKNKAPIAMKALNAARPKKELTEEEKTKLKIKALKKAALLEKTPRLPTTEWTLYFAERIKSAPELKERRPGGAFNLGPFMKTLVNGFANDFKALPASERERLRSTVEQNKLANAVTYRNWVESYTPKEINAANNARNLLKRVYGISTKHHIVDPRIPKQPIAAYVYFVQSRWDAAEFNDNTPQEKFTKLGAEWKALSADQRKPFEDIAATDLERYEKEMQATFEGWRLPKSRAQRNVEQSS